MMVLDGRIEKHLDFGIFTDQQQGVFVQDFGEEADLDQNQLLQLPAGLHGNLNAALFRE